MLAITHVPSPRMELCECTFVPRSPIDYERAVRQHAGYCAVLADTGAKVVTLDVNRDLADCAFIEDTAVVLDDVAILTSMGAASRRMEPKGIEQEIRRHREIRRIEPPAILEGGDVLRVERTLLAGRSGRTNAAGIAALAEIAGRHGLKVRAVPVRGCLHLKTACTALPDGRLLVNADWLDVAALADFQLLPVPGDEPWGANVLLVGEHVCIAAEHPQTAEMLRRLGFKVRTIELSEFAKAEGGVTCLSLLLTGPGD